MLDETFSHTEGATKNHLELRPLRRADLGRRVACVADNTAGRETRRAAVWVDMIRKTANIFTALSFKEISSRLRYFLAQQLHNE